MTEKELAKQIGRRIRELRSALSLTQEELAERADISVSFLSMMERSERMPHLTTLGRVADELRISLSQMFIGVEQPQINNQQALLPLLAYLERLGANSDDIEALIFGGESDVQGSSPS